MSVVNTKDAPHRAEDDAERNDIGFVPQVVRFAIVGLMNTGIDLAVLNALIAISHRGRSGSMYSIFKAISFLVAVVNSYFMNSKWTFRQSVLESNRFPWFLLVSVAGLVINVGASSSVASLMRPVMGLESFWPSIAAVAGAACRLAFNFGDIDTWSFLRALRRLASLPIDLSQLCTMVDRSELKSSIGCLDDSMFTRAMTVDICSVVRCVSGG